MIEVARIRTAIDELLVGTIGTTRKVTAGTVSQGHERAWEGLSLIGPRYDLFFGALVNHPSTPLSALANYRVVNLPVTITLYFHFPSAATEDNRNTVRANIYSVCDMIIQALGMPNNLRQTSAALATGIVSGMLTNLQTTTPREDWDKQIAIVDVTGTAIVYDSQLV